MWPHPPSPAGGSEGAVRGKNGAFRLAFRLACRSANMASRPIKTLTSFPGKIWPHFPGSRPIKTLTFFPRALAILNKKTLYTGDFTTTDFFKYVCFWRQ